MSTEFQTEMIAISSLQNHPRNYVVHPQDELEHIKASVLEHGIYKNIVIARDSTILAGHGLVEAARGLGIAQLPVIRLDIDPLDPRALQVLTGDNEIMHLRQIDDRALADLFKEIRDSSGGLLGTGYDDASLLLLGDLSDMPSMPEAGAGEPAQPRASLAERFGVPPFSVLDARQGYWQARKRAWIALGIKGELGRGDALLIGDRANEPGLNYDSNSAQHEAIPGGAGASSVIAVNGRRARMRMANDGMQGDPDLLRIDEYRQSAKRNGATAYGSGGPGTMDAQRKAWRDEGQGGAHPLVDSVGSRAALPDQTGLSANQSGTSVFDPVLCELVYRWFNVSGGHVLDPFAGEATKGIVASYLGYGYTGVELRQEQVDVNYMQARGIGVTPDWICGDSADIDALLPTGASFDLIFTSPPYYDLEIYSESEKDGSAFATYATFMAWYRDIFRQSVARLRDNRFLVVKVGEVRDKKTGIYRNFLGDNIQCMIDAGMQYYNEAVLITAVGSLPIRVAKQFEGGRKLGKTHQNILVFYKGDPKAIKLHFSSEIDYADLSEETD